MAGYWLENAGRASEGRGEEARTCQGPVRKQFCGCGVLDLSLVERLGGNSAPRTHRALIQVVEKIAKKTGLIRQIGNKARVTELMISDEACLMNVWISFGKRSFYPDNH